MVAGASSFASTARSTAKPSTSTRRRRRWTSSVTSSARSSSASKRILRCPRPINGRIGGDDCRGELRRADATTLECTRCGARYSHGDENYDFLPADLAASSGIVHTDNISSWGHDPIATQVIRNSSDGLVLDAGSGFKSTVYDNVVNLEVVGYPSTDVLGVGEHLPFADGAFDAALSLNVLEHVRDPFRCATELARVVRPGGKVYASAPFLQPYHGYPHHYYNMTASGLENLFDERVHGRPAGGPGVRGADLGVELVPELLRRRSPRRRRRSIPEDERRGVDGVGRGLPRRGLRDEVAGVDQHRARLRLHPRGNAPPDLISGACSRPRRSRRGRAGDAAGLRGAATAHAAGDSRRPASCRSR